MQKGWYFKMHMYENDTIHGYHEGGLMGLTVTYISVHSLKNIFQIG